MSGNAPPPQGKFARPERARKVDRRVRRTRDALGDALVTLMHEKPFEAITVQQILDRAGISRSTFYTHYSDKSDLFLSDVEEFFEAMSTLLPRRGEISHRVLPVRELFAHVADMEKFYLALVSSGQRREVLDLGQGCFARAIEKRLAKLPTEGARPSARRTAIAHALAGALLSLMDWWIGHDRAGSPQEMDDLYHRIVWSGVRTRASQPRSPRP